MADLDWLETPRLERPIMVVALRGLFDAAEAATGAVQHLSRPSKCRPVARIDPEHYFDFTEERPNVRLDEDGRRRIAWPTNECCAMSTTGTHDLLLLAGVEPHLRWRTFSDQLVKIARGSNAEMVITLGSMVGLAPHTRPLGVVGSTTNKELATRMGLGQPSYEGPTGVVGAFHEALDDAEIPVISLRVSIPHYVPSPPNPEATRSLLRRFEIVTGIETGHADLDQPALDWRQRVDAAVADDPQLQAYVAGLENQVDESDDLLPSGEDLAMELEAFLRDDNKGLRDDNDD